MPYIILGSNALGSHQCYCQQCGLPAVCACMRACFSAWVEVFVWLLPCTPTPKAVSASHDKPLIPNGPTRSGCMDACLARPAPAQCHNLLTQNRFKLVHMCLSIMAAGHLTAAP